ncbi:MULTISPECIES: hypothetical protein [Pandoraea]|uniref:Uncharacterized protein n=2 Tax=Pandoraea TaxID=93217 RepID=A0A5E4XF97_9BURK|nr:MULTISPECIES: hypothetical protein [Pandoraea]VVE17280.1 hypothetical protein PCE31107_02961 [Pandoraea cepalis]VVE35054.1 hypothetical protein PTE31013_03881 [Pandoraea terrigena]
MNSKIPNNTESPKSPLQLLQEVVAAQMRLWDARLALEKATAHDGAYSDRTDEAVLEEVNWLAAGLNDADEAYTHVADEHLQKVLSVTNR